MLKKIYKVIAERIRRFFHPTIEEALRRYAIAEPMVSSKEELESLKRMIDEYEKKIASEKTSKDTSKDTSE